MKVHRLHPWPDTTAEATALQRELSSKVVTEDRLGPVRHVAGIDVGFEQANTITRAAVVVLSYPDLELREQAVARRPVGFPYIPGFLSFREGPAVLDALEKLRITPDLLLCDGQGLAHPRRFGIACHLGLLTDRPSIGVAKSRLVGSHEEVPQERGAWRELIYQGEVVGAVLRTRANTRPLFISVGHRIGLLTAINYVMGCTTRYRLPETTRCAHRLASSRNDE